MSSEEYVSDQEPLELVAVCGSTEGQMIEELLKNNGIDCTLQGDVRSTPWPRSRGRREPSRHGTRTSPSTL